MSVRIRLARGGRKKQPFYRLVIADKRMPRDGRYVERVGSYNPMGKTTKTELNVERIQYWLGTGALPSDRVKKILELNGFKFNAKGKLEGVTPVTELPEQKPTAKKSKKTQAKEKASLEAEAAVEAKPEATAPAKEAAAPAEKPAKEDVAVEAAPAEKPVKEEVVADAAPETQPAKEEAAAEDAPAEKASEETK